MEKAIPHSPVRHRHLFRDTIKLVRNRLRDGFLLRLLRRHNAKAELAEWFLLGCPLPPPQVFKQKLIRDIAAETGVRILVETGTLYGDTIAASLGTFEKIFSIELYGPLYEKALRRFSKYKKVDLRYGDSEVELPRILAEITEPTLFWLDAHYSGDGTARSIIDTPIVNELLAISQHHVSNHVILIDDARLFNGMNDYPTIETCNSLAAKFWPGHHCVVAEDIIRITPRLK